MKKTVLLLGIFCLFVFIRYLAHGNYLLGLHGYLIFVGVSSIFGVASYIPFIQSKSPVKYYIIYGSAALILCSWISLIIYLFKDENLINVPYEYSILYAGLIVEVLLFALALGHKQFLILEEKNFAQHQLILRMKENQELKDINQQQLERDLEELSRKIEEGKMRTLKAQHEVELADLKLSALRSQMNPHFIFNSLNSIKLYIINKDQRNAIHYLNKFSKLIRNILSQTRKKEISIKAELETMALYVYIENIRFDDEIIYTVENIDQLNLSQIMIPSLLLQPFIENAIWHGLSLKNGEKKLFINISKNAPFIKIQIGDNGIGRDRSKELNDQKFHKKESVGIELSKERLLFFSKERKIPGYIEFEDYLDSDPQFKGTLVNIYVPL